MKTRKHYSSRRTRSISLNRFAHAKAAIHNRKLRIIALFIFAAALLVPGARQEEQLVASSNGTVSGGTRGHFEVDSGGQASYSFPLTLPRSRNDLLPQLSLAYNSHSRDGFLGYGFQLAGLPRIHRCARTMFHDGYVRGVRYDNGDAFCLDGERLILVNGDPNQDGAEYRLYRDNFTRITSVAPYDSTFRDDGNPAQTTTFRGPRGFFMQRKDGAVFYFGFTVSDNPRILAGNGQVSVWALNMIHDNTDDGNFVTFKYLNQSEGSNRSPNTNSHIQSHGDYSYYPDEINYGGKKIKFEYTVFPDSDPRSIKIQAPFAPMKKNRRLNRIVTSASNSTVKEYRLTYADDLYPASRLVSITECGQGECFAPTDFNWQAEPTTSPDKIDLAADGNVRKLYFNRNSSANTKTEGVYADFNGDGFMDFSAATCWNDNKCDKKVYHGSKTGFTYANYDLPGRVFYNDRHGNRFITEGVVADINGDGLPDFSRANCIKGQSNCLLKVWHGTGSGFVDSGYSLPDRLFYSDSGKFEARTDGLLKDFNGDGRLDYVNAICEEGADCAAQKHNVYFHTGNGFQQQSFQLPNPYFLVENGGFKSVAEGVLEDMNGDGLVDYSRATEWTDGTRDLKVWHGTGSGFESAGYELPGAVHYNSRTEYEGRPHGVLAEINGDGLLDYTRGSGREDQALTPHLANTKIYHGTASGFVDAGYRLPGLMIMYRTTGLKPSDYSVSGTFVDFNGDNRPDFVMGRCLKMHSCPTPTGYHQLVFHHNGKSFVNSGYQLPGGLTNYNNSHHITQNVGVVEDFNGDGLPDYSPANELKGSHVRLERHLNLHRGAPILALISEGNGRDIAITYMRLNDRTLNPATGKVIHTRPARKNYPYRWMTPSMKVVSEFVESDRFLTREFSRTAYEYVGLEFAADGRGSLGFETIRAHDKLKDLLTVRKFSRVYPYNHMPVEVHVRKGTNMLMKSEFVYTDSRPAGNHPTAFQALQKETVTHYEGSNSYKTEKTYVRNQYGDVLRLVDRGSTATSTDDITTCTTYENHIGPDRRVYRLGFPKTVTIAKSCDDACNSCQGILSRTRKEYSPTSSWSSKMLVVKTESYDEQHQQWLGQSFEYDNQGNITKITEPDGTWTEIEYENTYKMYPISETVKGGSVSHKTTLKHEPAYGQLTEMVDPNGLKIRLTYDGNGRPYERYGPRPDGSGEVLLERTTYAGNDPYQIKTTRRYSEANKYEEITEHLDVFGRMHFRRVDGSDGGSPIIERFSYGVPGSGLVNHELPHYESSPIPLSIHTFDDKGRPVRRRQLNGIQIDYTYSIDTGACDSCVLKETMVRKGADGKTLTTVFRKDARGNTRRTDHGDGRVQNFVYDGAGRLTRTSDPGANTVLSYDQMGRTTGTKYTHSGQRSIEYDAFGRTFRITDARGETETLSYDSIGRVASRVFSDGRETQYRYDEYTNSKGRLSSAWTTVDGVETYRVRYAYDIYGRESQKTIRHDGQDYSFQSTYDRAGQPVELRYPDGRVVTQNYDARGRLADIKLDNNLFAEYNNYSAGGEPGEIRYSNGAEADYDYNLYERLESSTLRGRDANAQLTTLVDQSYTYNGLQLLKKIDDLNGGAGRPENDITFNFDKRGFLTQASSDAYGTKKYSYDKQGNLTKKGGTSLSYTGHRLKSGGGWSYKYDASGNRIEKKRSGKTWAYKWSAKGLLLETKLNGQLKTENAYDPFGERIKRVEYLDSGVRTSHYLGDLMEIVDHGGGATQSTIYILGPNGRIASITGSPSSASLLAPLMLAGLFGNQSLYHSWKRMTLGLEYLASLPGSELYIKYALLALFALLILGLYIYFQFLYERHARRPAYLRYNRRLAPGIPALIIVFFSFSVMNCQNDRPGQLASLIDGIGDVTELENGLLYAQLSGMSGPGAGYPVAGTYFYHRDRTNSVAVVTDALGQEVSYTTYLPYGQIHQASTTGSDISRYKFAGQELDSASNLIYFSSRFYDPVVGRFISADSYVMGGPEMYPAILNRYQYAGNNPVTFQDPDGHFFGLLAFTLIALGVAYLSGSAAGGSWNPLHWGAKGWGTALVTVAGFALGFGIGAVATSLGSMLALEAMLGGAQSVAMAAIQGKTGVDLLRAGLIGAAIGFASAGLASGIAAAYRGLRGAGGALESAVAGEATEAESTGVAARRSSECFAAGTLVETAEGLRPIESIRVGDRVLSRKSDASGEREFKAVTKLFITPDNEIGELQLRSADDAKGQQRESFQVTHEHPFYVQDRGWLEAGKLEAGDVVIAHGGSFEVASGWRRTGTTTTYNFEVAEFHTYYVGESRVWVHNVCETRAMARKRNAETAFGLNDTGGRRIPNEELHGPPPRRGRAPIGNDDHPVELHHRNQTPDGPLDEMTRTDHRLGENYSRNHPNTGQTPSLIDRQEFAAQRTTYWQDEWDSGRFRGLKRSR